MDQRVVAAGLGAVMGLALVLALALLRGPSSTPAFGPTAMPRPVPPETVVAAVRQQAAGVGGERMSIATQSATLELPSGRLALGDAYMLDIDLPELDRRLPRGRLPVAIVLAGEPGAPALVAAALVTAPGTSVAGWAPVTYGAPEPFYAGAETGIVGLAAAEVPGALARRPADAEALAARIDAALPQDGAGRPWADLPVEGHNLIAIVGGYGDGLYAAHWGLAADGAPVALLVEFGILDAPGNR